MKTYKSLEVKGGVDGSPGHPEAAVSDMGSDTDMALRSLVMLP